MKIKLLLLFFLPFTLFSQIQLGANFTNPNENAVKPSKFGTGLAISNDGTIVAVGAPGSNENSFVRIFKLYAGAWKQLGSDILNESVLEKIGTSVSLSSDGMTVAIGAPEAGNLDEGHVRIYQFKNDKWEKTGDDIKGSGTQHYLGDKVILTDDAKFLAVSTIRYKRQKGYVKVYENKSGVWTQLGTTLVGKFSYDKLGVSIALANDGKTLAVANKGRQNAKVYTFTNNDWKQLGSDFTGLKTDTRSGLSISLSSDGNRVAIGSKSGVTIYQKNSDTWIKLGNLIRFGSYCSLSSDGNRIAIGSPYYYTVRNYYFENKQWKQRGNDVKTFRGSNFGETLALSADGDTFIAASTKAFPRAYTFNTTLSLQKYELEKVTHVYPNPAVDMFFISFDNNNRLKKVIIYNQQGKMLLQSLQKEINISKLSKGIYFVDIYTNKGKITKKMIKK